MTVSFHLNSSSVHISNDICGFLMCYEVETSSDELKQFDSLCFIKRVYRSAARCAIFSISFVSDGIVDVFQGYISLM